MYYILYNTAFISHVHLRYRMHMTNNSCILHFISQLHYTYCILYNTAIISHVHNISYIIQLSLAMFTRYLR